jgi:CheY-like chemotaxis protein
MATSEAHDGRIVLVVDDDPNLRKIVVRLLRVYGYRVVEAADARAGLERLSSGEPPQLVIADLMMPEMDGVEFFRRLRERHPGLPVVLCSGSEMLGEVPVDPDRDGPVEMLVKPFRMDALMEVVRRFIG